MFILLFIRWFLGSGETARWILVVAAASDKKKTVGLLFVRFESSVSSCPLDRILVISGIVIAPNRMCFWCDFLHLVFINVLRPRRLPVFSMYIDGRLVLLLMFIAGVVKSSPRLRASKLGSMSLRRVKGF